jgi:glycosyltransferase involved in cell wall biosynthesis
LAAGLPVVVQDTGAGDSLPIGNGLLTFSSPEQATACLERVNADYEEHRRAAREVAREFFSADVVLPRLLQTALEAPASPSHR